MTKIVANFTKEDEGKITINILKVVAPKARGLVFEYNPEHWEYSWNSLEQGKKCTIRKGEQTWADWMVSEVIEIAESRGSLPTEQELWEALELL